MKLRNLILCSFLAYSQVLLGDGPLSPSQWYALTGSSNSKVVDAIDTFTFADAEIYSSILDPEGIAITPDRTLAYVASRSDNTVYRIDLTTADVTSIFIPDTGNSGPFCVAITPDGTTAYVGCLDGHKIVTFPIPDLAPTITTLSDPDMLAGNIYAIAITPDGTKAYAANRDTNVLTFSIPENVISGISGFDNSSDVAITPDGLTAYVANTNTNQVIPITIADNSLQTPLSVGNSPSAIAITANGTAVYVVNENDDSLSQIFIPGNTTNTIMFGPGDTFFGEGIAITPDSNTIFISLSEVAGADGSIAVIDISNPESPTTSFADTSGDFPTRIAITPDEAPIAAFSASEASLGSPTTFDASSSSSPVGTIASYIWDFGDGSTETVSTPTTTHTYATIGHFNVSLQVINSAGTSLSQTFTGKTVSNNGGPSARILQTVTTLPASIQPPTNLAVTQKKNSFLAQTDLVNILTWKAPSQGSQPILYRIYLNQLTNLIGVVSATGPLQFEDHNRKKSVYVYYIVSVDSQGNTSDPAIITKR